MPPPLCSDSDTTVSALTKPVEMFRDERDRSQFHDPRLLATAISIEAAELHELLLWTPSGKADEEARREDTIGVTRQQNPDSRAC
jgi:NTP pyrophosphatase (non-canonical NTP hydrolase)